MTQNLKMFNCSDMYGNTLKIDDCNNLFLTLPNFKRNIGSIIVDNSENILIYYKEISFNKHLFRKTNSIGFNWVVLDKLRNEDMIHVLDKDETKLYIINVEEAKKVGSFLFFKSQGFEKQFFISVSHFNKRRGLW
jgi:hypothetical protein